MPRDKCRPGKWHYHFGRMTQTGLTEATGPHRQAHSQIAPPSSYVRALLSRLSQLTEGDKAAVDTVGAAGLLALDV